MPHLDLGRADLPVIALLIFLEGILSLDNALVLALIVRELPKEQHKRALSYGLVGALLFRTIAIGSAAYLIHLSWVKFAGSAYLLYLAFDYFRPDQSAEEKANKYSRARSFWMTVMVVEMTDIAFAVDSILTAVALTQKILVVWIGGVLGLLLMRYAASVFIGLLQRFPRFEASAYALVAIIGVKLLLDGLHLPGIDFHDSHSFAFWIFWSLMMLTIASGFLPPKRQ